VGWIRTGGKQRLLKVAATSSGVCLESSWTSRKAYEVYFPMDLVSHPYLFRVEPSCQFCTKTFSVYGAASPDFGPMGHVSS